MHPVFHPFKASVLELLPCKYQMGGTLLSIHLYSPYIALKVKPHFPLLPTQHQHMSSLYSLLSEAALGKQSDELGINNE